MEALVRRGLEVRLRDVVDITLKEAMAESEIHEGSAIKRAAELTRGGVDAWVCSSEVLARSLLEHLTSLGHDVPGKVGITGFHGSQAPGSSPALTLTSTEAPSEELGAAALRRLFPAPAPRTRVRPPDAGLKSP